jgi:class 3 adenylate cyclase
MTGVPAAGAMSFLFTDVVGSTPLWESSPAAMGEAIALHDRVVRGAIESCSGRVFSTGGDGVAAVFARADDAVRAAAGAQAGLRAADWPDGVALDVRMGVHTGEADQRGGDLFGPTVNRAARVMSVARGQQVLVSEATASLIGSVPGCTLVDVGSRRLRGLAEPMALMVVDGPGLDVTPPPADEALVGNLPRPASEFVGRVAELRRRVADLSSRRLVTLTGAGGVGKTRLAIEAGWLAAEQFTGGVWLVELAPVGDGDAVPAAMLSTFGGASRARPVGDPVDRGVAEAAPDPGDRGQLRARDGRRGPAGG